MTAAWILLCLCLLSVATWRRVEAFRAVLAYPSKDYQTEASLPDDLAWLANPTKCFSCQREMLRRFPDRPEMAYRATNTKCFSCEAQLGVASTR